MIAPRLEVEQHDTSECGRDRSARRDCRCGNSFIYEAGLISSCVS